LRPVRAVSLFSTRKSQSDGATTRPPRWTRARAHFMAPRPFLVGRNPKLAPSQGGSMKALWQAFSRDESGQGLVEYALIIALVAVGLIAILLVLRNSIGNVFNNAATQLNNAPANPYP
jgi:pilus assembly protein Flp/PilA